MTKLEEEIAKSLPFAHSIEGEEFIEVPDEYLAKVAKAAAETAKKFIEKAWEAGYRSGAYEHNTINILAAKIEGRVKPKAPLNEWLKENGII